METRQDTPKQDSPPEQPFKKPLLVGKIGKLPKKFTSVRASPPIEETPQPESYDVPVQKPPETSTPDSKTIPYEEPLWSSVPQTSPVYVLEVLKNGAIIQTIELSEKAFWVFGRLPNCDICMQHPTVSRYHAVLQYKGETGFYIYDLESTHGTFLNKNRIRSRSYVRIHVGHMLKLGCSTRTYILNGPPSDAEEESALTVTELKQKREESLRLRRQLEEERKTKEEEAGIDWGLGEDADEETDLSENPYAQTNNEELYLDNPKKALRGFFEREGLELEYDCTEQGLGQFLCKVELPVDDEMGRPVFAEVLHKGKKKEAVVQCALEACRILDRHGVLRQATHESKKRKPKNWEENDYYDSDDDTFLDRTGTVERKREMRMNAKVPQKAETYDSLIEKEKKINDSIRKLQRELEDSQRRLASSEDPCTSEAADPLDSFMAELKQSVPSRKSINKLKSELVKLKQEHVNIIKLVNIAKPASLPPLIAQYSDSSVDNKKEKEKKSLPLFGKRKKIKLQLPTKTTDVNVITNDDDEEEEEEEEEGQKETGKTKQVPSEDRTETNKTEEYEDEEENTTQKERRKRNNQRRIQQKQKKAEIKKQKGYDEDAHKEDYNMWLPPNNQTGDGRTSLNDKYGY